MKRIGLFLLIMIFSVAIFCQSQEIEQLRLDIEKLAQMKAMLDNMYNGYRTIANGYNQVSSLAKGNFDLHKNFLDQLLQVSPQVRNSTLMQTIQEKQNSVLYESASAYSDYQKSGLFTNTELVNIKKQFDQIKSLVDKKLGQLNLILTPGSLRMSDQERISSIERIDKDVGDALLAERTLVKETTALALARGQRKKDIEAMRAIYGLKQ